MKNKRAYRCLERQNVVMGSFSLEPTQDDDIEDIRIWRNEQMDVLRQSLLISPEQQNAYFDQRIWPSMDLEQPENIFLTFFEDGKRIGYGGLVHISWEHLRAEVSFLLETSRSKSVSKRQDYFSVYIEMIKRIAFDNLGMNRLTTETFDVRPDYIQTLEKNGFLFEGRQREHIFLNGRYIDSLHHAVLKKTWQYHDRSGGSTIKVLLSSAGGKIPLVNAIKSASDRVLASVSVIAGDLKPLALAKYTADGFIQLPPTAQENITKMMDLCDLHNIDLVIPTRDGELEFWARNKDAFEARGIAVLVSDPAAIATSIDKLAFAAFGKSNNLPIIPAWEQPEGEGQFVVKERYGSGSRSIGLNLSAGAALEHGGSLSNPIYQPFIEGREISVDAWIDRHQRVKGLVLRERTEVANGESVVTTTFRDQALEAECLKVMEFLPLRGPVVLQLIVDESNQPHIIELNARFGGASTASISAGLDIWYWTLLELDSQDLELVPFQRSEVEIRQIRVPQDIVIYDPDI